MFKTKSGDNKEIEITKKIIISYHLSLLINHPWVAEVNTKIPIKEVIITINPCQIFSIPISKSSWLNKNTNEFDDDADYHTEMLTMMKMIIVLH